MLEFEYFEIQLFHVTNIAPFPPEMYHTDGVACSPQSAVDLSQFKYYKIGICFLSATHSALRKKSKDVFFVSNQDNVSEWSNLSTRVASTIYFQLSALV